MRTDPMTSDPSKSRSKRSRDKSQHEPNEGTADAGKPFDPMLDQPAPEEPTDGSPRYAPAPGVPMSNEQYEWLKLKAKKVVRPRSEHSQEDPSGKRKK
jgi:hypothetical protein